MLAQNNFRRKNNGWMMRESFETYKYLAGAEWDPKLETYFFLESYTLSKENQLIDPRTHLINNSRTNKEQSRVIKVVTEQ